MNHVYVNYPIIIAEIVYIVNIRMSGRFIVIEGPDGSGSTRHTELLAQNLRTAGLPVLTTAEPTSGPVGQTIRSLLDQKDAMKPETLQLLFCADRAEHVQNVILPALEQGKTVVSDRYTLSTIIYGTAMGVDRDWLTAINDFFPKPDLCLITLPPFAVCQERLAGRSYRDAFEADALQQKIYQDYATQGAKNCFLIDTSAEKEAVADNVFRLVEDHFSLHTRTV